MSISRQNLTVIIVTLKSEHIIDQCIQSIDDDISIIVVENSSNKNFKDYLEKKYRNVSCILSSNNIGMGAGNNIGIENAKSDFVLILNPDVILFKNTIDKLIKESNNLREFAIMSPISDNVNFPNYSIKEVKNIDYEKIFEVDSIDGFCMLINKNKIKSISKDAKTFDENFFMYLENDDLCKRVKKK
jgi:GT2 family glycosyltransferase